MFFELNKTLCTVYAGLDPLKLLDYPAEDVFDLINGLIQYGERMPVAPSTTPTADKVVRKPAGDNWF